MNIKMVISSQLSTIESEKQTKQTNRRGSDSQKSRLYGALSVWEGEGEKGGKGIGNKYHKW